MKIAKTFFSHFLIAIGAISAFIGAFSWLAGYSSSVQLIISFGILIVGVAYALFQIYPPQKIKLFANHSFPIYIEEGDLFNQKGVIIIPFNEYFDTIVDDKIIASNTIHGKFVDKLFKSRIIDLDAKIAHELESIESEENSERAQGNTKRYPLGTCISIEDGGNVYILVALTNFDEHNKASISMQEYGSIIQKVIIKASTIANSRSVYMPLLGSGQGGIKKSAQRILFYIINQIEFSTEVSIPEGLHIVIYKLSDKGINLDDIRNAWQTNSK